jgi:hypothetical protein
MIHHSCPLRSRSPAVPCLLLQLPLPLLCLLRLLAFLSPLLCFALLLLSVPTAATRNKHTQQHGAQ